MSKIIRNHIKSIRYLLGQFPIVALLGARQVGKSTLMRMIWPDAPLFDLENEQDWQRINQDPVFFLQQHAAPVCFDEAQLSPDLFKALRVAVDQQRHVPGQYLLSGSSSPQLLKNISESLAGRVAIYEMGGLTINEAYEQPPSALYEFIEQKKPEALLTLPLRTQQNQLVELCYYGGYPEHFLKRSDAIFHDQWTDNYLRTYIDRDIRALFPNLRLETYRRFIRMLAVNSGHLMNASQFAASLDVTQPTIKNYMEVAEGTFLWRSLPSFHRNLGKRLVKMPKGYIRDTGLLCRLLNIHSPQDLTHHPQYGAIWESFVIEQMIQNMKMQLRSFDYYFYRTHHQAEVDLVLEGAFGLIPIEIKTGLKTDKSSLKSLLAFMQDYDCPYGLVINNSVQPQYLAPNIIQLPAGCL